MRVLPGLTAVEFASVAMLVRVLEERRAKVSGPQLRLLTAGARGWKRVAKAPVQDLDGLRERRDLEITVRRAAVHPWLAGETTLIRALELASGPGGEVARFYLLGQARGVELGSFGFMNCTWAHWLDDLHAVADRV